MSSFRPLVTTLTTLLFVIIGITGVLIFFHLGGTSAKVLHEWIGLVFVLAALFHLMQNWRSLKSHLKKPAVYGPLVAVSIASAVLGFTTASSGEKPGHVMMLGTVFSSPLAEVAPLLDVSPRELIRRLQNRGYSVNDASQPVEAIAKANSKDLKAIFAAMHP